MNSYDIWYKLADKKTKSMLENLSEEEKKSAFLSSLSFGTAGLRGKQGLGTNRMNIYTVAIASFGLGKELLSHNKKPSVVIAHDTRYNGNEFVNAASSVLANMGIKVYKFKDFEPTPILTFSVKELSCDAGIVITASHNPKDYNGFKVVNKEAIQINDEVAKRISDYMKDINPFKLKLSTIKHKNIIEGFDNEIKKRFIENTLKCRITNAKNNLKLIYTPLNGTGRNYQVEVLKLSGYKNIKIPKSQELPNPDFTTCPEPNPELDKAFNECLKIAKNEDIIIANDPDADRFSAMVYNGQKYIHLSGNQIGILLLNYILTNKKYNENSFVVSTVVSSPFIKKICEANNVKLYLTLTGFKNIGEKIFERQNHGEEFLFAFEESCGYIVNPSFKDKDGISTGLLFTEMTAYYKAQNKTLLNVLDGLYKKYGTIIDDSMSISFANKSFADNIVNNLREKPPKKVSDFKITNILDYSQGINNLAKSNFIEYQIKDIGRFIVRPSGTEPKLKMYFNIMGANKTEAKRNLSKIKTALEQLIKK